MTSPNTRNIRINVDIDGDNKGAVKAAKSLDDTAKSADKAGDSLRHMGIDAKALNAEIATSNKRIAELRKELVEVGNDKNVRKALRGEESWLRELTKIQSAPLPDVPGGRGAMIGPLVGVGALGIATLAPAIGAMVAGAVTGAIGTGGIAGGLAMASKDARVKSSAAAFGQSISQEFFRGGEAFVGPAQQSLKILSDSFKQMDVPAAFAKMAPHVTTIAQGVGDLGKNFMPGFNRALEASGPMAADAAAGMADFGAALGDSLAVMAESEGAADGLRAAFLLLNGTTRAVGDTVAWLGDRYHELLFLNNEVAGAFQDLPGPLGWAARQTRSNFEQITTAAMGVAPAVVAGSSAIVDANADAAQSWELIRQRIEATTRAQDQYFNKAMAVPQANDALEASFDNFTESLKENGRTFDENTEKGRTNRDAMRDLISAAQDLRTAQINSTGSTMDANREYTENIATIERLAAQAGVTADELREMAGDYTINIRTNRINTVSYFTNNASTFDSRRGFAAGGTTPAHSPFWVGEKGPELMFSDRSHFVATNSQSRGMAASGGGGEVRVTYDFSGAEDEFARWVRKYVRVQGGGNVQQAFGRN